MNRRVLVAEDEPALRAMLIDIFEGYGFDVTAFANADEACTFISNQACPLDLLFTDVRMPGNKTGLDLAFSARQLMPDLPIVISSGYFDGPMQTLSNVKLLPKPWNMDAFVDACQLPEMW